MKADELNEFVKKPGFVGNHYVKLLIFASLGTMILFCGIIIFAGWQIFKPVSHLPNVWSLQDKWDLLVSHGHDWRSDAYLNAITFDVNESMPYKIEAQYLSKTAPDKIYYFDTPTNDDSITGEYEFDPDSWRENAKWEIKREDWNIDSIQAWNLFLKDNTISTCAIPHDKHVTIYMTLDRIGSGRVAWELYLGDCPEDGVGYFYYLDAKTGETIDDYFE